MRDPTPGTSAFPILCSEPGLRVLHVVTDRDRRGAQVFATDLAKGLDAIGFTNTVVALTHGEHDDLLPVDVLGRGPRSVYTVRQLRRAAKGHDVVVAHGSSTLLACACALLWAGVPFVYRQISDPLFWASTWPRRLRTGAFLRRAAMIVALSNSTRDVVCHHYRLPPLRTMVIPNAATSANFTVPTARQRREARRRLGLEATVPTALYVGALAPEKGVDLAINAIAEISEAQLLIVGSGPALTSLRVLSEQRAPGRVHFAGPLEDPTQAMHAGDVIVLTSRGGDSMPGALIEAGLCGLSAVSTAVGAITDVVVHEETGLIATVGDQRSVTSAVRRLIVDPDLRGRYGRAARDRCLARFTIEATAPAWASLLLDVRRRGTGRRVWMRQPVA